MATYTVSQLTSAAYTAGFRGNDLVTAVAVSLAENQAHDTHATNHNTDGTYDRGAWQINSVHKFKGNPYNLQENALMAHNVKKHQGWNAWTTYTHGDYKRFMPQAAKAVAKFNHKPIPGYNTPQTDPQNPNLQYVPMHTSTPQIFKDIGAGVDNVGQGIGNVASAVASPMKTIGDLGAHLLSPNFWRMVGIGVLALALIAFGFFVMAQGNKNIRAKEREGVEVAAMA